MIDTKGKAMEGGLGWRFGITVLKLLLVSLFVGTGLEMLDINAALMLAQFGLTPSILAERFVDLMLWAWPNIMLGAMIVLPVWLVFYLLKPPFARDD